MLFLLFDLKITDVLILKKNYKLIASVFAPIFNKLNEKI